MVVTCAHMAIRQNMAQTPFRLRLWCIFAQHISQPLLLLTPMLFQIAGSGNNAKVPYLHPWTLVDPPLLSAEA